MPAPCRYLYKKGLFLNNLLVLVRIKKPAPVKNNSSAGNWQSSGTNLTTSGMEDESGESAGFHGDPFRLSEAGPGSRAYLLQTIVER
jgi:hypothetical protein